MSAPIDPVLAALVKQNAEWVQEVNCTDPGFFPRSAEGQDPKVLWIGCADSRVPESVITKSMPGAIFTHRNIANQVFANDPNAVSVITYALLELGVEHIIVAGHSHCGGVAVCLDEHLTQDQKAICFESRATATWPPPAPIDEWLTPLRKLAESYPHPPTLQELVEENVRQQVKKVVELPVVQSQLGKPGAKLKGIHGWWYELETGYVHDLNVSVYGARTRPAE
ncbi:hypothetical protein NM688_g1222 [Phlebia brevispora]|uniref:Uncharacterized protein n=1 Tax=Phlebia brevispora TaxID=194682 RepID=A0ACC1TC47_9APHY|nr:hypothetical protein NM688_g1222 [Phlebia brevispora]